MDAAFNTADLFLTNLFEKNPEIAAWAFFVIIIIGASIYFINKRANAEIQSKKQSDEYERKLLDKMLEHNQQINNRMSNSIDKVSEAIEMCISVLQVNQSKLMKNTSQNERQYNDIKSDIKDIESHISEIKIDIRDINTKVSSCIVRGDKDEGKTR